MSEDFGMFGCRTHSSTDVNTVNTARSQQSDGGEELKRRKEGEIIMLSSDVSLHYSPAAVTRVSVPSESLSAVMTVFIRSCRPARSQRLLSVSPCPLLPLGTTTMSRFHHGGVFTPDRQPK